MFVAHCKRRKKYFVLVFLHLMLLFVMELAMGLGSHPIKVL